MQVPLFIWNGLSFVMVRHLLLVAGCSSINLSISCSPCHPGFLLSSFDSGYDHCFENPSERSDDLDFVQIIRSLGHYHHFQVSDATSH